MIVFLDMDGVIVDFIKGLEEKFGKDLTGHVEWGFDYEGMFGMTGNEFWNSLTDEWWESLPWTVEGKELIEFLESRGHEPILLSSPARNNAGGKQRWIKKNLPHYHRNDRYLLGAPKWAVAGTGKVLIDDYDKHCNLWFGYGGSAIVFPRPWNTRSFIKDPLPYVKGGIVYYEHIL